MARISLRSPSSWATEINFQSRYPGGILVTKIGAASPSACPDAGAMEATTPATVTTAISKKAIRVMRYLLRICVMSAFIVAEKLGLTKMLSSILPSFELSEAFMHGPLHSHAPELLCRLGQCARHRLAPTSAAI